MARFSGNPIKNPLAGNEFMAATDASTNNDIAITPIIITQFVMQNGQVANGSSNGLIDATNYAKLIGLETQAQTNVRVAQLAEVAIPLFVAAPTNTSFAIYQHVCDVSWTLAFDYLYCSAGSTNVTLLRNGTAILGFTNNPATTTPATFTVAGGTGGYTFNQGDILGITFTGTTGNCANMFCSIRANANVAT